VHNLSPQTLSDNVTQLDFPDAVSAFIDKIGMNKEPTIRKADKDNKIIFEFFQ